MVVTLILSQRDLPLIQQALSETTMLPEAFK